MTQINKLTIRNKSNKRINHNNYREDKNKKQESTKDESAIQLINIPV